METGSTMPSRDAPEWLDSWVGGWKAHVNPSEKCGHDVRRTGVMWHSGGDLCAGRRHSRKLWLMGVSCRVGRLKVRGNEGSSRSNAAEKGREDRTHKSSEGAGELPGRRQKSSVKGRRTN